MTEDKTISFGDNVRVRETPETKVLGLSGIVGNVHGETTPSVTGVQVIGVLKQDYAINVYFKECREGFWFTPDLLEFVDHAPGTEIIIKGSDKKWVRTASGEWEESSASVKHKSFWERITGAVFRKR